MLQIDKIVFSKKAAYRLAKIADYIYEQSRSEDLTIAYMSRLEEYISDVLLMFPEAGRKADEYNKNIRKLVYQGYSILYRINEAKNRIEIANIFRENLP
jgi:plasmid stabilization system protein ParE